MYGLDRTRFIYESFPVLAAAAGMLVNVLEFLERSVEDSEVN